jgi:hypothetical protein
VAGDGHIRAFFGNAKGSGFTDAGDASDNQDGLVSECF